jgi:hypothetical protein
MFVELFVEPATAAAPSAVNVRSVSFVSIRPDVPGTKARDRARRQVRLDKRHRTAERALVQ